MDADEPQKKTPPPILLASASETRRRMLASAGITVAHAAPQVDEAAIKRQALDWNLDASAIAARLADAKALAGASQRPASLVIGADQVLQCDGRVCDKPVDRHDAATSLRMLRGRTHRLISAVAVVRDDVVWWRCVDQAALTMRHFSDDFLEHYLDRIGEAAFKSVGAYQLEGPGVQLFSCIEGDFFTVLGMPLLPLLAFLRDQGVIER